MGFAEYLFSFILFFVDVKESLVGVGLVSYDNKFKIAQLEKGTVLYLQVQRCALCHYVFIYPMNCPKEFHFIKQVSL